MIATCRRHILTIVHIHIHSMPKVGYFFNYEPTQTLFVIFCLFKQYFTEKNYIEFCGILTWIVRRPRSWLVKRYKSLNTQYFLRNSIFSLLSKSQISLYKSKSMFICIKAIHCLFRLSYDQLSIGIQAPTSGSNSLVYHSQSGKNSTLLSTQTLELQPQ